ncbi:small ribosomal subunit protein mS31 [Leptinotarsa decemlineata]|uniref:small ribosomal subunit protein mS31 n=1 Tax=Leptinotarsa decemlineata TaxID=7539 RepID=UPI003D307EA3
MKVFQLIRRNHFSKDKFLCSVYNEVRLSKEKSTQDSSSSSDSSSSGSSSSDSDSDGPDMKPKNNLQAKKDETLSKLNTLLQQLLEKDVVAKSYNLDLAKPTNKRSKKDANDEPKKTESKQDKMVNAVKNVAQELGGNVRQTESELLTKLLEPTSTTLSEIIKDMKIDREPKSVEQSKADEVRSILQQVHSRQGGDPSKPEKRTRKTMQMKPRQDMVIQRIDLFGAKPLGIFTNKDSLKEVPGNETWQAMYERDLKLCVTHPPSNYFQQMISWTEQGKLWNFPIDNEQGLDEEKKVYFAKHIFLEEHLEPWCPSRGPIRHFMELVCVGLSKNPYLTVEAKKEHIDWYKNYFEDKKKLLQEVGAFPVEAKQAQKSVE